MKHRNQVNGRPENENEDTDTPELEPNIVADTSPVSPSKKKKVTLVGCGFCLLLFLICAGIGLPLLAKFKRAVIQALEDIKAANEIEKQRLEEQYEMPEAEESETIDDDGLLEWLDVDDDDEQSDEAEQSTKPTVSRRQPHDSRLT